MLRTLAALLLCSACASVRPPSPDRAAAPPPSLAGRAVMVLPAQPGPGTGTLPGAEPLPGFDAELAFFLAERAPRVRWIPAAEVERAAGRSRTLGIRLRELDVAAFLRMRVTRIGDPLFGDLHTLGLLLDARYALLPYAAYYAAGTAEQEGRVELGVALIDTSDGDVLWTGAVAGTRAMEGDPAAIASAASALAERFGP